MTQNQAHTWLLVAWIILTPGTRLVSPGQFRNSRIFLGSSRHIRAHLVNFRGTPGHPTGTPGGTHTGTDRFVSVFTPDDHCVGFMAGASAGALWRGVCDSNGVCDVVPNGSAHLLGSMARGDRLSHVLDEECSPHEVDGSRGVWERSLVEMKGRQRPFPILDDHIEPVEDIVDGSIRRSVGVSG